MNSRSTTRKIGTVTLSLILMIAAVAAFLFADGITARAENAPVTDLVTEINAGDLTKAGFAEHMANGDGGYCEIAGDYFGDVTTSLWRRRYVVESEDWEETLLADGDLLSAGKYRYRLTWTADGGYAAGEAESELLVLDGAYKHVRVYVGGTEYAVGDHPTYAATATAPVSGGTNGTLTLSARDSGEYELDALTFRTYGGSLLSEAPTAPGEYVATGTVLGAPAGEADFVLTYAISAPEPLTYELLLGGEVVSSSAVNAVYTGDVLVTARLTNAPSGISVSVSAWTNDETGLSVSRAVDVGSYSSPVLTLSGDGSEIYSVAQPTLTLTVTPKTATLDNVSNVGRYVYNRAEQRVTFTFKDGDRTIPYDYYAGNAAATDANGYALTIRAKGNYTGNVTIPWTIEERTVDEGCVSDLAEITYNGEPQSVSFDFAWEGETIPYIETGDRTATEVGEYTLVLTATGNYKGDVTVRWSIGRQRLTLTACDLALTYGDAAPAANDYSFRAEGYLGEDDASVLDLTALRYECAYRRFDGAGKYAITLSGVTAANYDIAFVAGELVVDKRIATIVATDKNAVYGDPLLSLTTTASGIVNGDDVYRIDVGVTARSPVGDYPIEVVSRENPNYELQTTDGVYHVRPRVVTLSWSGDSFVYDGAEKCPTLTLGNLVNGDVVSPTITGAAVRAGRHISRVTALSNGNYALPEHVSAAFTVAKAPARLDLSGMTTRLTYTGEELLFEGATVPEGTLFYEGNRRTEIGKYTATLRVSETENYLEGAWTVEIEVLAADRSSEEDEEVLPAEERRSGLSAKAETTVIFSAVSGFAVLFIVFAILLLGKKPL